MSNFEPYPNVLSEAASRVRVADKLRQSSIVAAALSGLSAAFEVGYRYVEALPNPIVINPELKGAMAAFAVSATVATGSSIYESVTRRRYGMTPEVLKDDKLTILESTER